MPAERVPILMYHGVSPTVGKRFSEFVVPPARFEEQMEYLAETGFRVCGISDLVSKRADDMDRLLGLTFDDAFQELSTHAVPVLERLGFGATIYVPTAFIGDCSRWLERIGESDRRIMDVDELRGLAARGIECGAHSHTHPALDTLSRTEVEVEVETSKSVLEDAIERPVRTFAYPFGYQNASVREAVRQAGFDSACGVNYAVSTSQDDLFCLSRLPVAGGDRIETFRSLANGQRSLLGHRARALAWRPIRRGLARVTRSQRRLVGA